MSDAFDSFLGLSVQLCGLSRFDLLGTGYGPRYYAVVERIVGADRLQRLLDAYETCEAIRDAEGQGASPAGSLEGAILNHPEFGPIARNITKLWFSAVWFELPPTWRANFGTRPGDRTFIPFPHAYAESLLGPAVGAHPAGAKPGGHQSWVLPPVPLPIPDECS